jgi:DNA transformation protein
MEKDWSQIRELTDLPNIGAVVAAKLKAVGVVTPRQLKEIGSIEAALRIRAKVGPGDDAPCASMLSGLEGAIRGLRWHGIPKAHRDELWRRYCERVREQDGLADEPEH